MSGWRQILLLVLLAAPLSATEPPLPTGPHRLHDHWSVTCDNLAACVAINTADPRLTISRDGGWNSPPQITLSLTSTDRPPTHLRLVQLPPGNTPQRRRRALIRLEAAGAGQWRVPRSDALAFFYAARDAGALVIVSGSVASAPIALGGLTPAMDHFDHVQTRTGTITGIYTRGTILVPLAAIMPPPTPLVPAITGRPLPPDTATASRLHLLVCGTGVLRVPGDVSQAEMADGTRIFGLRCGVTGINAGRLWLVQRPGEDPTPARFPLPYLGRDDDGLGYQENSHFDPATGVLHATMIQREAGDCGAMHTWQWTASGFQLIAARAMPLCIGLPPDRWPHLWRADVAR